MDERYSLISYDPETIEHHTSADLADILSQVQEEWVSWIVVRGIYLLYLLIRLAIGHFDELISGGLFRFVEELEDDKRNGFFS